MANQLSRREFLRRASGAAAGLAAAGGWAGVDIPAVFAATSRAAPRIPLRRLGRTGLKVSEIGIGAMTCPDGAVLSRAFDLGVNYVDTAECYQGGNNERMVGQALRGRKGIFVATKWHPWQVSTQQLIQSAETSLSKLGVPRIDLIQFHDARSAEQVRYPAQLEAYQELHRQGKVRFLGITTHSNQAEVLRAAADTGWYHTALVAYNFLAPREITDAITYAAKAGMGIIVMKSVEPMKNPDKRGLLRHLAPDPFQAALKWVLNNPHVSVVAPGMNSFQELDDDLKAAGRPLRAQDGQALARWADALAGDYCQRCGACTAACPREVAVDRIIRFANYHLGYRQPDWASQLYRGLPAGSTLASCDNCGQCVRACPHGVRVMDRLRRARSVFA